MKEKKFWTDNQGNETPHRLSTIPKCSAAFSINNYTKKFRFFFLWEGTLNESCDPSALRTLTQEPPGPLWFVHIECGTAVSQIECGTTVGIGYWWSVPLVLPPDDPETQEVVETLAQYVAKGGPEVEQAALENNKGNPSFWWVCFYKCLRGIWCNLLQGTPLETTLGHIPICVLVCLHCPTPRPVPRKIKNESL